MRDLLIKIDNVDLEKNSEDIKESIMTAILSLTDQISFVEETEEIKDFVEEKTDEINQHLLEVRNQLKQIASSGDDDYSYTLQDVETDIAKLRIALSEVSPTGENFGSLSQNINRIVKSVEGLENTLTQDQVFDLKNDIEKLNDDILSLSSRTNKLVLTVRRFLQIFERTGWILSATLSINLMKELIISEIRKAVKDLKSKL